MDYAAAMEKINIELKKSEAKREAAKSDPNQIDSTS